MKETPAVPRLAQWCSSMALTPSNAAVGHIELA